MDANRNILISVIFRVVVCAGVLLGAIVIFAILMKTAPKPAASGLAVAMPRVEVMQAQAVPVRRQWQGYGTATAMDSADVPARVTSTVIERPENIRAGSSVTRSQLLVRLDDSDFVRQVEIATNALRDIESQLQRLGVEESSWSRRAELAAEEVRLAQADYERLRQALERDAARQREVDQAQRNLFTAQQAEAATREEFDKIAPRRGSLQAQREQEQATLRLAVLNVERCRIVSPIDGVLESVDVEIGENITANQPVARVISLARIEVPLQLAAAARADVNIGDEVQLNDGNSPEPWIARVTRIGPSDNRSTRTMVAFVELDQSHDQRALPPGKFVQGVVVSNHAQPRWVVPRRSIENQRIKVVEQNLVKSRGVDIDFQLHGVMPTLGLPDRQWAVLKEPLPKDALIVVDSSRTLAEGSSVVPVLKSTAAGAVSSATSATSTPPSTELAGEDAQP